jgi:hypothetical protein
LLLKPPSRDPKHRKGEGVIGGCWQSHGERRGVQGDEALLAIAVLGKGGVLGVVSLATPQANVADISTESASFAVRQAAETLSNILSDYGVRAG